MYQSNNRMIQKNIRENNNKEIIRMIMKKFGRY